MKVICQSRPDTVISRSLSLSDFFRLSNHLPDRGDFLHGLYALQVHRQIRPKLQDEFLKYVSLAVSVTLNCTFLLFRVIPLLTFPAFR